MQPTFMPWAGYFHLMASVDVFVFLDDVQFDRRSWQSRNRIFDGGNVRWLTCPTIKSPRSTLINEVRIDYQQNWRNSHLKKLQLNYIKTDYYEEMVGCVAGFYNCQFETLAKSNIQAIQSIAENLNINTQCINASELDVGGKRSEHLVNICRCIGADSYLSPKGSQEYITQDNVFEPNNIKVEYQQYVPSAYPQFHSLTSINKVFESHLSVLDVIANIGLIETQAYVFQ